MNPHRVSLLMMAALRVFALCAALALGEDRGRECTEGVCDGLEEIAGMKSSMLQMKRLGEEVDDSEVATLRGPTQARYGEPQPDSSAHLADRRAELLLELQVVHNSIEGREEREADETSRRRSSIGSKGAGSCATYGCSGGYERMHDCQCTDECAKFGNCCSDRATLCSGEIPPSVNSTSNLCVELSCGGDYVRGRPCQCTDDCEKYGNCCADWVEACKPNTPPPTPEPPYGIFDCESNLDLGVVEESEHKGLALDDTTFENCANELPTHWPNTKDKVLSVRLFKPWGMTDPKFFGGDRHHAWKGLKGFAQASGAKFLIGVSVTCRTYNDDKEWAAGREFIEYVGAEHVMGIAVGNEIDLQVGASYGACVNNLWNHDLYYNTLVKRVEEFDAIPGVRGLPITAVLSMFSMNAYPFKNTVKNFLSKAWDKYGDRFKFSINVYPQFSSGLKNAGCQGSIDVGTKFTMQHPAGFIPNVIADIQKRLNTVGLGKMKIWLGEHGWATSAYCVLCSDACHRKDVQQKYYQNFLKWDLSASDGTSSCGGATQKCGESIAWAKTEGILEHPEWYTGLTNTSSDEEFQIYMASQDSVQARGGCPLPCDAPGAVQTAGPKADHVFYFTLRDSSVFGKSEAFGIIERCGSKKCKFQK